MASVPLRERSPFADKPGDLARGQRLFQAATSRRFTFRADAPRDEVDKGAPCSLSSSNTFLGVQRGPNPFPRRSFHVPRPGVAVPHTCVSAIVTRRRHRLVVTTDSSPLPSIPITAPLAANPAQSTSFESPTHNSKSKSSASSPTRGRPERSPRPTSSSPAAMPFSPSRPPWLAAAAWCEVL